VADTLQFDLVSPERKLASLEAVSVQIPGMGGDFTAMPNHAPFLTTLRPGVVTVKTAGETSAKPPVTTNCAVSPTAATILAERAVDRAEADSTLVADLLAAAEHALADAPQDARMAAGQRVRDVMALRSQLGV